MPRVHAFSTLASVVTVAFVLSACGSEAPETVQYPAAAPGTEKLADRGDQSIPTPPRSSSPARQESTEVPSYDGTLVAMVESAIAAEPELNTLGIDISAADGTVYLRGEARTRETRQLATEVASKIDGVKQVQNELFVTADS
ncbi:MAG: BON domain-containing protein [Betaproteobacteria bacterium]|nr:BON domain-containing protein [Betaproteobacteria bacterium]